MSLVIKQNDPTKLDSRVLDGHTNTKSVESTRVTLTGPEPEAEGIGHVSVYAGATMSAEATLREIYQQSAKRITEQAREMIARGTSVEDAARWAVDARNQLKIQIRARGSTIVRGLAEARNIRKYGNPTGPSYDDLIRQEKSPEQIIGSAVRPVEKINRIASRLRVAGRFFIAIDVLIVTWDVIATEGDKLRVAVSGVAGAVGGVVGGAAGAKIGGAIGTVATPGLGTAIGTGIGGLLGALGGAMGGGYVASRAAEAVYDLMVAPGDDIVTLMLESLMNEIDATEDARIRGYSKGL